MKRALIIGGILLALVWGIGMAVDFPAFVEVGPFIMGFHWNSGWFPELLDEHLPGRFRPHALWLQDYVEYLVFNHEYPRWRPDG